MSLYDTYTDEQLLELLKGSDDKAFTAIYDRYAEKVFAIAYTHCKQKPLAEEAMQDVFMSLWQRRGSADIRILSAYLATAARFTVFAQLQKELRRSKLLQQGPAPQATVSEEPGIHARFLKNYIADAVAALPEKCRLVYRYSREEDMKIHEIADEMGITPKAAENYLARALKALRISLKDIRLWLLAVLMMLLFA